jgi:hypothetical protein
MGVGASRSQVSSWLPGEPSSQPVSIAATRRAYSDAFSFRLRLKADYTDEPVEVDDANLAYEKAKLLVENPTP